MAECLEQNGKRTGSLFGLLNRCCRRARGSISDFRLACARQHKTVKRAGQNPRSTRSVRPSRWSGKLVTGKSFSRPVSGRLTGTAGWRRTESTTEPRGTQRP